jgi:hypothetical protein
VSSKKKPELFLTRTYALYKPVRARSLRAASARDTFVLGNEINRAAFHSAFMTPEGLSGRIDVKRTFCVLIEMDRPSASFCRENFETTRLLPG